MMIYISDHVKNAVSILTMAVKKATIRSYSRNSIRTLKLLTYLSNVFL